MPIAENLYVGSLAAAKKGGFVVNLSQMQAPAAKWSRQLDVKTIDSNARVIELSGGNRQKAAIAKSSARKPKPIIFDEPTRGVDVGAIAEIHERIRRLAEDRLAVIAISTYPPEALNLSDRIPVSQRGRIVEEFRPSEATEERIMFAAVHGRFRRRPVRRHGLCAARPSSRLPRRRDRPYSERELRYIQE